MLIKADIKLFAHHIDSLISGVVWRLRVWTWRNAALEFIHARAWSCVSVDPDQMLHTPLLTISASVFFSCQVCSLPCGLSSCCFFNRLWCLGVVRVNWPFLEAYQTRSKCGETIDKATEWGPSGKHFNVQFISGTFLNTISLGSSLFAVLVEVVRPLWS